MTWAASLAMSRAVTRWAGSARPQGLRKTDFSRPSSRARRFINSPKASSEPARPSASVIAASLPLSITSPLMRSSMRTREFNEANIEEPREGAPPVRQACSETMNVSSSLSRPSLIS